MAGKKKAAAKKPRQSTAAEPTPHQIVKETLVEIEALVRNRKCRVVARNEPPEVMRMEDGGLMIRINPPSWGVIHDG